VKSAAALRAIFADPASQYNTAPSENVESLSEATNMKTALRERWSDQSGTVVELEAPNLVRLSFRFNESEDADGNPVNKVNEFDGAWFTLEMLEVCPDPQLRLTAKPGMRPSQYPSDDNWLYCLNFPSWWPQDFKEDPNGVADHKFTNDIAQYITEEQFDKYKQNRKHASVIKQAFINCFGKDNVMVAWGYQKERTHIDPEDEKQKLNSEPRQFLLLRMDSALIKTRAEAEMVKLRLIQRHPVVKKLGDLYYEYIPLSQKKGIYAHPPGRQKCAVDEKNPVEDYKEGCNCDLFFAFKKRILCEHLAHEILDEIAAELSPRVIDDDGKIVIDPESGQEKRRHIFPGQGQKLLIKEKNSREAHICATRKFKKTQKSIELFVMEAGVEDRMV
jgi:hypothetical protein